MNIRIRRAVEADAPKLCELAMKLVRQHQLYNPLRFVSFENHKDLLADFVGEELKNPKTIFWVAEKESEIVGYALICFEEESLIDIAEQSAWLHDIYVEESARGLNAGKLLLEASVDAARELGSRVLKLHVAPQNEIGQKLFEKFGFELTIKEMMFDLKKEA